jgi:hypothetical protein
VSIVNALDSSSRQKVSLLQLRELKPVFIADMVEQVPRGHRPAAVPVLVQTALYVQQVYVQQVYAQQVNAPQGQPAQQQVHPAHGRPTVDAA